MHLQYSKDMLVACVIVPEDFPQAEVPDLIRVVLLGLEIVPDKIMGIVADPHHHTFLAYKWNGTLVASIDVFWAVNNG